MGMVGKQSRAAVNVGLSPRRWVVLFEKEDPTEDPVFNYRGIDLYLAADHLNTANTEIVVQDSVDGTTWATRLTVANPLVPGGELSLNTYFRQRWVRVLLYSTGGGRIDGTLAIPEDDVTPGLWPDINALACASYCEVSDES